MIHLTGVPSAFCFLAVRTVLLRLNKGSSLSELVLSNLINGFFWGNNINRYFGMEGHIYISRLELQALIISPS